ncbi:MAG: hypothetical protein DMD98_06670 [Candidatus Rokuibacteriota bacterium]|jgi:lipopolysaccharide biosynthesis regulator YciM|nr:MAG: hypothetical protein AUH14_06145 [Candidatus Rokubacteria bacterium 13_2_20CM_69_15_1]OLB50020.1 MAG: hypothetical protein AUH99_10635 [Candidatus Rokubacteria bacterium 13_2_20CM_2_70_11]PYN36896.1 MAG: hypothetical protein DMD98_06670 [Candidatus Rokubacteria bacterium]
MPAARAPVLAVTVLSSLRTLFSVGFDLKRLFDRYRPSPPGQDDPEAAVLLARADAVRRAGRHQEAGTLYRQLLQTRRSHLGALRGLRDLAAEARQWGEALELQQRIVGAVGPAERSSETEWLAILYYELGRAELARSNTAAALAHLKSSVRTDRAFLPAALALGDAYEASGDRREAMRVWERAAEGQPVLPLLVRLERCFREEGRPSRMIALYRQALEKAPDELALAVALGRVFFELEMLDEATDQFEKVEVRAPDLAVVHAYLGAVFERRGETQAAFEEYRRALQLGHAFDWPHRCAACGAASELWQDQCPGCRRWNTLRPVRG